MFRACSKCGNVRRTLSYLPGLLDFTPGDRGYRPIEYLCIECGPEGVASRLPLDRTPLVESALARAATRIRLCLGPTWKWDE